MSISMSGAFADDSFLDDPTSYRQLVGSLMYMLVTRPGLSFAVNRLCQFMHSPTHQHLAALKRVLCYVKGSLHLGLRLPGSMTTTIHAFSDSDWAGCQVDRRFKAGFAIFIGSSLVSWVSRKQLTIARSFTEVEYRALADVAAEVV
ncbi:uncharacterized protein LOC116024067 [Ipomoea triloba]|uniref:uncharacterized protein LOC116024067 n=1 Tax=Ipomoea triloba TaxID=35885 RepID=UPI00125E4E83|nr:uncharacterized protein LOC116024067 [Ipomoea triloba]